MSTQISHSIAQRAYYIWEQMGRPDGQALEHWLRAEAELLSRAAQTAAIIEAAPAAPKRGRRKKA
jgi:Protein of unknown function (DUF2934)